MNFSRVMAVILLICTAADGGAATKNPKVRERAALKTIQELPEVRAFEQWLKAETHGKVGLIAYCEDAPDEKSRDWQIYVGEDHDDHAVVWNRFRVDSATGEIHVSSDVAGAEWITLDEWRRKRAEDSTVPSRDADAEHDKTSASVAYEEPRGRLLATLRGCAGSCVAFSDDGKLIATAGGGQARVWDAKSFAPVAGPFRLGPDIRMAQFTAGAEYVVIAGDNKVVCWNFTSGGFFALNHPGSVLCAAMSPDGKRILTGCTDMKARVWDIATRQTVFILRHLDKVGFVAYSGKGDRILTYVLGKVGDPMFRGAAYIWSARTGEMQRRCFVDDTSNQSRELLTHPAAFSPDGTLIATIVFKFVAVWNPDTRKSVAAVEPWDVAAGGARTVEFSRDGKMLVTATVGPTLVWDLATD